jgi:HEAT repeat protein
MTEPKIHRRIVRHRKKNSVPLSKLRTSDAVRTIVDHPRRLQELLWMLEDKDRGVRARAAAAVARLSESHPARLQRAMQRLCGGLVDESAYVRWHLVYSLGRIGLLCPVQCRDFLRELVFRLDDENRIVRVIACKALTQVADRRPGIIEEMFQTLRREIPPTIARAVHSSKTRSVK